MSPGRQTLSCFSRSVEDLLRECRGKVVARDESVEIPKHFLSVV